MNDELEKIASIVLEHYGSKYGVTREMLNERNRKREVSYSRFFIFSIANKLTKIGLRQMGNYFNIIEHASVINGIKRIDNFCKSYPNEKIMYENMLLNCKFLINNNSENNAVLFKMFDKIVTKFINLFEKKQDLTFDYWVNDKIGEIAVFGDYSFNFTDILYDLRNNKEIGNILNWYNSNVEFDRYINYHTYCMGLKYEDL